jgi:glutathione S-transferase
LRAALHAQGLGRNSPAEVDEIAKKDLTTLSTLLGDKNYLYGDRPTTIDATLFGTLVSLWDPPLNSKEIKPFMEQQTPNLVAYIKRIKSEVDLDFLWVLRRWEVDFFEEKIFSLL